MEVTVLWEKMDHLLLQRMTYHVNQVSGFSLSFPSLLFSLTSPLGNSLTPYSYDMALHVRWTSLKGH